MKLTALFTMVFLTSNSNAFAADAKSQNETININLKLPTALMSTKGLSKISLDRIDLANKSLNLNSDPNHKCELCDFFTSGHPSEKSKTSLAFTYGNGKTFAKDPNEGGNQQWDYDLRLSNAIGDGCMRIDTGLLNEGHPENHHRDGFYLQLTCRKKVLENIRAEFGVGPYFSMDTTKRADKVELDQKGLNVIATAALNYYIGKSGLHLRLECNGVKAGLPSNAPDSIQCMAGVGQDFSAPKMSSDSSTDFKEKKYAVELGALNSKTNHGGTSGTYGGALSLVKNDGHFKGRVGALITTYDGAINERQEAYADANYRVAIGEEGKTHLYTGAGIIAGRNHGHAEVAGKINFVGVEHDFDGRNYVAAEWSRIFTFSNAPTKEGQSKPSGDSDVFMIEAGHRFDGL
ncbi:MAG: hypothetical protein ACXVCP_08930 [Bdellovibrio sp.]